MSIVCLFSYSNSIHSLCQYYILQVLFIFIAIPHALHTTIVLCKPEKIEYNNKTWLMDGRELRIFYSAT